MRFRLRTLLTQFSIRDLLWLIIVAGLVACLIRERLTMAERLAAERAADTVKVQAQLDLAAKQMDLAAKQIAGSRRSEILALQILERNSNTQAMRDADAARAIQKASPGEN